MGYIYRSSLESFYIDTPVIGLPGNFLNINIIGGFSKYNGPYFLAPSGSNIYNELRAEYGLFGYGGIEWEQVQLWANLNNKDMILFSYLEPPEYQQYGTTFYMLDLSYFSVRNSSPEYGVLYNPYLPTISGIGSYPEEWIWDKNILLYPAGAGTPLAGLNSVPGDLPNVKLYSVDPPFRTALRTNQQNFIVQGDRFQSDPNQGLPPNNILYELYI